MPSGWAPLELVNHLVFMERRWMQWGFAGEAIPDPWGDDSPETGRWTLPEGEQITDVLARLNAVGVRTRSLAEAAELTERARTGGRFPPGSEPPTLSWILLHVLQEYARHTGHLDISRELTDGSVGE